MYIQRNGMVRQRLLAINGVFKSDIVAGNSFFLICYFFFCFLLTSFLPESISLLDSFYSLLLFN